jgi:hypothetical protein
MTTNNINNTLALDTNLILDSFTIGQGKTNDIDTSFKVSDKIKIDGLKVWCNGDNLTFISEAHKNAYFTALLYRSLKDLPQAQINKLFNHVSKGYLSLNHKDSNSETIPDYTELFNTINSVEFKRVSPKSKLYTLLFDVNPDNITVLTEAGFVVHTPIVDNTSYKVSGFTVELPKKD